MIRAVIKNSRIFDGKSFIGMGILGMLMSFRDNLDIFNGSLLITSIILYVGYAFAINNCFDVDTDLVNPRKRYKNPIANGELSFRMGIITALFMIMTGLIFSYFVGKEPFVVYSLMSILATFYSVPPRFKSIPIADIFSHGLFFGVLPFIYGAYFDGVISEGELLIAGSLFMYSIAMELRNHLEDYDSDQRANLKTTPMVIGKSVSEKLVISFSIASLLLLLTPLYSPFAVVGVLGVVFWNKKLSYRMLDGGMVLLLGVHALKAMFGV
ncbi:UbiA family prenyltransferase [Thermococcus argininiproducens]|uniref:UbiA family prenyltransferase n=1 Tax=Thermococcus argininiproducens TaxID=2866384 RepID=A0A9E7M8I9_9EURY|nr:UbiA family prenyltransferase [Thermococcus argininiproducens]USG99355.1 UbiA family prenyltransferase [Thermococcus argininiproducens]